MVDPRRLCEKAQFPDILQNLPETGLWSTTHGSIRLQERQPNPCVQARRPLGARHTGSCPGFAFASRFPARAESVAGFGDRGQDGPVVADEVGEEQNQARAKALASSPDKPAWACIRAW